MLEIFYSVTPAIGLSAKLLLGFAQLPEDFGDPRYALPNLRLFQLYNLRLLG